MLTDVRISRADASRRFHHSELLVLAGHTLENYGQPELAQRLLCLASQVHDGTLSFDPPGVP